MVPLATPIPSGGNAVPGEVSSAPWADFVEEVGPWIRSKDSARLQEPMNG